MIVVISSNLTSRDSLSKISVGLAAWGMAVHTFELFRLDANGDPIVLLTTVVLTQDQRLREEARELVLTATHYPPPDGINVRDVAGKVVFTWLART